MQKIVLAATCAVAGLACATAQAAPAPVTQPTTIKVGGFFPGNSSATKSGGNTLLSVGADYAVQPLGQSAIGSVYGDYEGGNKNGGRVSSWGVGYAVRSAGMPDTHGTSTYAGAGLGYYQSSTKDSVTKVSKSKASLGGKLFAGVNFAKSWVVEANYQFLPKAGSITPSGFGVQVGMRF